MSKIYLIPQKANIIEEFVNLILKEDFKGKEKNDFSKILVVFPGERPISYLYNYLGKEIKRAFFPPKALSIDKFIDLLLSKESEYEEISKIDALYYLYEIYKNYKRDFDEFEKFISYGERILKFIDELDYEFDEDISIKDKNFPLEIKNDLLDIIEIRKKFHEKLKLEKKFVENFNGFKYFCAEKIKYDEILNDYDKIYFVGIYGITNIEKKIVKKIISGKDTTLIWQSIDDKHFLQSQENFFNIKSQKIERNEEYENESQNIKIFSFNNSFMQFVKIKEILEDLKAKNNLKNSCIVVPESESVIPLLSFIGSFIAENNFNIGLDYSIKNTIEYSLIESLINTFLSIKKEDKRIFLNIKKYLNIIKNPLLNIKNLPLREPYFSIDEIELKNTEAEIVKKINKVIKNLLSNSKPIEEIKNFVEYLKIKNKDNYILDYILEKLNKIENCEAFKVSSNKLQLKIILEEIKNTKIKYKTRSPADLEILSPLETENLNFDNLIIIDAQEGILPIGKTIPLLFPNFVYENLDNDFYIYSYNEDKYKYYFYRYEFYRLLKGAKNIYFFYDENYNTTRSRYIEKLIFEKEKEKNEINAIKVEKLLMDVNLIQNKKIFIKKDEKIIKRLENLEFSPTIIEKFLRDQIKFFYEEVLGIKEKELGVLEAKDFGIIIHKAMSEAYGNYVGVEINPKNADEIYKEIYENLKKFLNNKENEEKFSAFYIFKEIALKKLKFYIEQEKREIIEKNKRFKVLGIEKNFNTYYELTNIANKKIKLTGRIDRIDYFPDEDKYVLVDYKTGNVVQNPRDIDFNLYNDFESIRKGKINFQFPIYVFLFQKTFNIDFEKIYTKFVSFDSDDNEMKSYGKDEIDKYLKMLNVVIEEILNPEIPIREY